MAGKDPFTIFQRPGSSIWWMRFSVRGEGQIRKTLGTTDEAEARRKANKLWHEAQYRKESGLRAVQRSFRAVAEEFCDHMDRLALDGEVRHDRGDRIRPLVERYFVPFFDKKPIDTITDADLTRYTAWRKAFWTTGPGKDQTHIEYVRAGKRVKRPATEMRRIPSLSSQRGEAVMLRQLFRQAAKWGYINQTQIPSVETPRVPPSPRPSYSNGEMDRLTKLAQKRMNDKKVNEEVRRDRTILYAYVTIACCTGMRPTELKNLNWGDLLGYREGFNKRLGDRDIRIRARGKGKFREFIPLEFALGEFDRLWRIWETNHDGRWPTDEDPIFAAPDGRRLTSLNNSLNALLEVANLKTDHRGKKRDAYEVNGLNQYTKAGSSSPTYDANGNLTAFEAINYAYDVENRLTSASGATNATLSYDPMGRLNATVSGGSTTRFLYDGDELVGEYDGAGNLLRRYVHGPNTDEPLLWYEGGAFNSGDRRLMRADHQGSIVVVADASGNSLGVNSYDEWGNSGPNNLGRFAYTGQIIIPELKLYHYKARVYSPRLGRFFQTDPVGYDDQINLYAYVANDPVNHTDPTGQQAAEAEIVVTGVRDCGTFCTSLTGQAAADFLAGLRSLMTASRLGPVLGAIFLAAKPTELGSDDTCARGCVVYNKAPDDASDPKGAKAPGKPGAAEGFKDPKSGSKWGKAPNGKSGWVDDKGRVWVPTGPDGSPNAHGGAHWDVQKPGGGYTNVYPGGNTR